MDAPVPLIIAALLGAGALVAPSARVRSWLMLGALIAVPILLIAHVYDNSAFHPFRAHPLYAVVAGGGALLLVAGLALLCHRRPSAFPLLALGALPFRVPISSGGQTSNLLVPLYLVIGAGVLAYVVPRLRVAPEDEEEDEPAGWVERFLAASLALYAIQAAYSDDFGHAFEQVVFFYLPFALLFLLLARVSWTRRLALQAVGVVTALALAFVLVGFVEYATKHLLLNPKVITSNEFSSYFRVNSLFFDPNIYGRFLAIVMLALAGGALWARRVRDAWLLGAVLAVLWAGLVLTFSQSSFAALLLGLALLGGLRWNPRRAALAGGALVVVGVVLALAAPGALRLHLGNAKAADSSSSGRYALVKGGLRLFGDKPVQGFGSGGFARAYRRHEHVPAERAVSASHTIPVTVAAEQGLIGLIAYLGLLLAGLGRLFRGASRSLMRAVIAASFAAVVLHTLLYAAFLEDPLAWALLGIGSALVLRPVAEPVPREAVAPPDAPAAAAA